ncbi:flagellar biosynthesis protein FlhF, partial [Bordetella petrii]|nr:flagellar biosynthesis protein FlhF [Bordetella petrii]
MNISRFIGASSREVMRQVREALGPDALIVSNRKVPEGVEVLATLDEPQSAPAAAPQRAALPAD